MMIYINYTNLDDETQQKLLADSKRDIEKQIGEHLRTYAEAHRLDYNVLLEEEAIKNLYNYKFEFSI